MFYFYRSASLLASLLLFSASDHLDAVDREAPLALACVINPVGSLLLLNDTRNGGVLKYKPNTATTIPNIQ